MITLFASALSAAFLGLSTAAAPEVAISSATTGETNQETHRRTVVFEVQNMSCVTCPIAVKAAMNRVDGVEQVEIDYQTREASVTFDPRRTSSVAIAQASTSAGYPAALRQD
ncbi:hypothetical protein GCM10011367_12000 [Marinicauda pacifica]|jgi:mercuric ion binding protein|uniref:HMA domain-containing protein n=1 Tax=Marinicauda pacifica TaxID=1133559 RepID=A0A4S2HFD8_9PROT|nr:MULTISPECIES: cation transporter [Marinicauda]TGY94825.1 hypothetical protein E5162_06065 [Marinicauda pacifica]GGE39161.1 hypothetical protein GCM10011367_12000 [Marinicauda pacifica]